MKTAANENPTPRCLDWRAALARYRDLLSPRLLIRTYPVHQSRFQRLFDAGMRSRTCCLAYVRTH